MKAKLHLVYTITIFLTAFYTQAQQDYWKPVTSDSKSNTVNLTAQKGKQKYFTLDEAVFKSALGQGQVSSSVEHSIMVPDHTGQMQLFQVRETSVLHPDLAKKYPGIKSYTGLSVDKKLRLKLSSSHRGIQGMIVKLSNQRTDYIARERGSDATYRVYEKAVIKAMGFVCATKEQTSDASRTLSPLVDDMNLRRFRIAVSVTGEYTDYHGGTVADALAAINATLTRVNQVFENDFGVTLELVPNNDEIIFTDPDTDPYSGNLVAQSQTTINGTIGAGNYDVGHLFNRVGQGQDNGNAGSIGTVCRDNLKGGAFSAAFEPEGDTFDIDYVAHEIGHQFGANHTWSFQSEGTGVQAEPGSGTTIMGYAGIVPGDNVQLNSDDYFHYNSIFQVQGYLGTIGCGQSQAITNTPPVVVPSDNFNIPIGTAFFLEGSASDSDAGDVLTYTWESINDGVVTSSTFGPEQALGSNFRSLPPTTEPIRYFPRLSRVLDGNLEQENPITNGAWETISNVRRDLRFALTVRDNALGGGQVVADLVDVSVFESAGPFTVLSQGSGEDYAAGSVQDVLWDVANTNAAPINTENVDILLSIDGGNTFSIVLAEDTPNDGEERIQLPNDLTTEARIMVRAEGNVFYAVNADNFTISAANVALNVNDLSFTACPPADIDVPFTYETFSGFSETSTFSIVGPANLNGVFVPATASANDTPVTLTLSNTANVTPGEYEVIVRATSASQTTEITIDVVIHDGTFPAVVLTEPLNAATEVSLAPTLKWDANPIYEQYEVEIATDVGFTNVVDSATLFATEYVVQDLISQTEYFWRVRPINACGTGTFGTPFSFTTEIIDCKSFETLNVPQTIAITGNVLITAEIQVLDDIPIADLDVDLVVEHTFVSDLSIDLISPSGTRINLINGLCGDLQDIEARFDDEGSELQCDGSGTAITGPTRPLGKLSSFDGESSFGVWRLEVFDSQPGDGGSLVNFGLSFCAQGEFRPDADEDGVFDDGDDLCLGTPPDTEVDATGCPVFRLPADNFLIEIQSESCRSSNNGTITVTAVDTNLTYTATLTSSGGELTQDFTDELVFSDLSAETYTLCFTATDGTNIYQEVCFNAELVEPEPLSVLTSLQGGVLTLELQGSELYNIELNGWVSQTRESKVDLNLTGGRNTVRVFTNLPCQGEFSEQLMIPFNGTLYPNPTTDATRIWLEEIPTNLSVSVFDLSGAGVDFPNPIVEGNELVLDVSGLSTGTYVVKVTGSNLDKVFKILKK